MIYLRCRPLGVAANLGRPTRVPPASPEDRAGEADASSTLLAVGHSATDSPDCPRKGPVAELLRATTNLAHQTSCARAVTGNTLPDTTINGSHRRTSSHRLHHEGGIHRHERMAHANWHPQDGRARGVQSASHRSRRLRGRRPHEHQQRPAEGRRHPARLRPVIGAVGDRRPTLPGGSVRSRGRRWRTRPGTTGGRRCSRSRGRCSWCRTAG